MRSPATMRSPACKRLTKFQASLMDPHTFSVTWELVPGRGSFERSQEIVLESANAVAKGGKVHALTITDNPGGFPAISSEMLSAELALLGVEPLVHFTCKDKNRNQLEGLLYGLEREGVHNLLALTGDYTSGGYLGRSSPIFDLDSCHLLDLIGALNRGLEVRTRNRSTLMKPTHFCAGAAVSPFKALEAEQVTQYYKLLKKLQRGAQFIVTQLGFDARKMHEALLMMRTLGFGQVPLVGNIYLLSSGAARMMNRNGLAGCVVTDELMRVLEKEAGTGAAAKDKRLDRAAKMYALIKGMDFADVHVGGHRMTYEDLSLVAALHLPPVNHDLRWTSSWINFYMERDQSPTRRAQKAVLHAGTTTLDPPATTAIPGPVTPIPSRPEIRSGDARRPENRMSS